ncbi:MAG: OmpA family protein [Candidatus Kapabacteria bacterium]|nr:OmpA family protein [Candidatus Kapabacteria bacterium]
MNGGFCCAVGLLVIGVGAWAQVAPTILLQGVVLDAQTRKPIGATLVFFDQTGTKVTETRSNQSEGGAYQCILKPGNRYTVELRAERYMRRREIVELPPVKGYTELSRDFVLQPKAVGQRLIVSVPLFELNSSTFRVGADEELSRYVQLLRDNPDVHLSIECYPDRAERKDLMLRIAQERATAIKKFFTDAGITEQRITTAEINTTDPYNPPPRKLRPKGRFYYGGTYFVITKVD